jgi:hypothetical protein
VPVNIKKAECINAVEFADAARAIYGDVLGDRFQSAFARDLTAVRGEEVSMTQVRQWILGPDAGGRSCPHWLTGVVIAALEVAREDMRRRALRCAALADELEFTKLGGAPRPRPLAAAAGPSR